MQIAIVIQSVQGISRNWHILEVRSSGTLYTHVEGVSGMFIRSLKESMLLFKANSTRRNSSGLYFFTPEIWLFYELTVYANIIQLLP